MRNFVVRQFSFILWNDKIQSLVDADVSSHGQWRRDQYLNGKGGPHGKGTAVSKVISAKNIITKALKNY